MNECMHEWMSEYRNECMDGWIYVWIQKSLDGWADAWTHMNEQTSEQINKLMNKQHKT